MVGPLDFHGLCVCYSVLVFHCEAFWMIGKIIDVALIFVVLYGIFTFGKCRGYFTGYTDGQIQGYMVGYDSFYERMYFFLRDSVDASKLE